MPLTTLFDAHPLLRTPPRVEPRHYRKYAVILIASLLGTLIHAGFILLFHVLDATPLAAFNVASVAAWLAALVINRRGRHTLAILVICVETSVHAVFAVWTLGSASGFHYYLWPVACLATLTPDLRSRHSALLGLAGMTLFTLLQAGLIDRPGLSPLAGRLELLRNANVLLASFSLVAFILIVRRISEEQEKSLTLMATRDALTGLYNRHFTLDFLRQLSGQGERGEEPSCVVLGDVDNFKAINDRHGHHVGDACLRAVANELSGNFRKADCLCRWGGEEFLIVLPATRLTDVTGVLERFTAALRAHPVPTDGVPVYMTMSFGVIEIAPGEAFDDAIGRADRLLYRAKARGRNLVITERDSLATEEPPLTASPG